MMKVVRTLEQKELGWRSFFIILFVAAILLAF